VRVAMVGAGGAVASWNAVSWELTCFVALNKCESYCLAIS